MIIFTDLRAILVRAKQFSQNFQFALFSTCTVCLLTDLAEKLFEIGQFWRRHMNTDSISLPIATLKTRFGQKLTLQWKKCYGQVFSGTPCIFDHFGIQGGGNIPGRGKTPGGAMPPLRGSGGTAPLPPLWPPLHIDEYSIKDVIINLKFVHGRE